MPVTLFVNKDKRDLIAHALACLCYSHNADPHLASAARDLHEYVLNAPQKGGVVIKLGDDVDPDAVKVYTSTDVIPVAIISAADHSERVEAETVSDREYVQRVMTAIGIDRVLGLLLERIQEREAELGAVIGSLSPSVNEINAALDAMQMAIEDARQELARIDPAQEIT